MSVLIGNSTSKNRAFIYSRWWKSRNQTCSSATLTGAVVDCPYGNLSRITKPVKSARRFLPREDQSKGNVPSAEPCQFGIRPWTAWIFQSVEKTSYKMPSIMRNGRTSLIADLWKSEVRQLVSQISLRCGRRNSMPQRTPMRCK